MSSWRSATPASGIPPDVIKKIFDPFFTTKAVGKGTGLGLSQVYGFAHQSGGAVRVKSEVGRGTTITLSLPRSHAAVPARAGTRRSRSATRLAEGTILVVEDNPDVRDVTATLLEQIGYRVLRAENAAEALAQLQGGADGRSRVQRHRHAQRHERHPSRAGGERALSDDAACCSPPATATWRRRPRTRFAILRKPFELSALERAVRETLAAARRPHAARRRGGAAGGRIAAMSAGRQPSAAYVPDRTTRLILSSVKFWPPIDSIGGVLVRSTESTTPWTSLGIETVWPLASLPVTEIV